MSKVSNETIIEYCQIMGYKLLSIDKIAFRYMKKDGTEAVLLKSAATYRRKKPDKPRFIDEADVF